MNYVGLLTDKQKRAGCFTSRDKDFVYLFHGCNGTAECIGIFPYDLVTVKEIVDAAQKHLEGVTQ